MENDAESIWAESNRETPQAPRDASFRDDVFKDDVFAFRSLDRDRPRPLYQQSWWKLSILGLSGASLFLLMTLLLMVFP